MRLIDADWLNDEFCEWHDRCGNINAIDSYNLINSAPTVDAISIEEYNSRIEYLQEKIVDLETKLGYGDDVLISEELERTKEMLIIACQDVCRLDGSNFEDYMHDLGCRDIYEEYFEDISYNWIVQHQSDGYRDWKDLACPICKSIFREIEQPENYNYCPYCGTELRLI